MTYDDLQDPIHRKFIDGLVQSDIDVLSGEWGSIAPRFTGAFDSELAIKAEEPFEGMSHAEIYSQVRGIQSNEVNAIADVWRALAGRSAEAATTFAAVAQAAIGEKWQGASATKAARGIAAFSSGFADLPLAMQMTANGLDLLEARLAEAKANVPPPQQSAAADPGSFNPFERDSGWKTQYDRETELEEQVRTAMITQYRPGVRVIDSQTPVLPVPENPIAGYAISHSSDRSSTTNSGLSSGGPNLPTAPNNGQIGTPSEQPDPTGTQTGPASTSPAAAVPSVIPSSAVPAGPASDDPSRTRPTTLDDPLATTRTDSPTDRNRRSTGNPTTPGPARDSDRNGVPLAAAPIAGLPTSAGGPDTRSSTPSGVPAGRHGMPGMGGMAPGATRGKGDDDEHKIPSYLIDVDNGNKLIGKIEKVSPPVLGA
ncbi:hypothetical protein JGU71_25785 [Antrihabitans sp. YC3-6]|uniref:PPE domain-containing protein n=1 Tax=Antrihabitans stalagmiti TaxID=2799499 RepID=A0A934NW07_9NOCA|nr:hypothetical protein [Antrihabitans stalagmiti]MBJ8342308.1 hypothetical protein [Antrihabitans stalagmiti]